MHELEAGVARRSWKDHCRSSKPMAWKRVNHGVRGSGRSDHTEGREVVSPGELEGLEACPMLCVLRVIPRHRPRDVYLELGREGVSRIKVKHSTASP